jgi:hypothetical protein
MIEDYPYVGIKFSRDPDMPIPPREERGELGTCFLSYLFLVSFIYISFYIYIRVLTTMYLLCTDMGLVHLTNFSRTRQCPQPEAVPTTSSGPTIAWGPLAGEDERVLRWVERNLTTLTCVVPMAKIKDLPPSMQPHVVGVPRTWVQFFRRLAKTVIHYGMANRPRS